MPYFEDFEFGQKAISPGRTITDGMATLLIDVGGFIADQFNNKISAEKTPLGWRAIPGRVAFALMGGLVERMGIFDTPGPAMLVGADKLVWKNPLRVGDTVHIEWEVIELRKTSNPKWGLVKNIEKLISHDAKVICEVEITHLIEFKKEGK
jgi:acyl dehydratase